MIKGSSAFILLLLIMPTIVIGSSANRRIKVYVSIDEITIYNSHDSTDRGDIKIVIMEEGDLYNSDFDIFPSSGTYDIQENVKFKVNINNIYYIYEQEVLLIEIWEEDKIWNEGDEWLSTEYDNLGKIFIQYQDQIDQTYVSSTPSDAEIRLSTEVEMIDEPILRWGLTRNELMLSPIILLALFILPFVLKHIIIPIKSVKEKE